MPRVKKITVGGEEVAKEIQMASGKMIKEVIGHRVTVSAAWDAVPAETMAALHTMLRQGGYFTVSYPDPAEGDVTASFSISYPTSKIFKFNGTAAYWHGVSLKMTAQDVI